MITKDEFEAMMFAKRLVEAGLFVGKGVVMAAPVVLPVIAPVVVAYGLFGLIEELFS
jgi:hypothetical protein